MSAAGLAVTFFADHTARLKRCDLLDPAELARQIDAMVAPEKAKLPWLKLARFGDRRSDKGSLRHDANVLCISGVEGDYDGEEIAFDEAIAKAEQAGLQAIFYTSPSHTPERPRWRILCPTSQELSPENRARLVARVNGVFGGALAIESYTLSQSYYFGKVAGAPEHRVQVLEGTPIDLLEDLDRIAIAKPNGSAGPHGTASSAGPFDEAAIAEQIIRGTAYHTAAVRLVGKWAQNAVPFLDAQRKLEAAFDAVFPPERDERWQARRNEIPRIVRDIYGKDAVKADSRANGQAGDAHTAHDTDGVSLADFFAYMPMHNYIYAPARAPWPASSVNARVPPVTLRDDAGIPLLNDKGEPVILPASAWLDRFRPVEMMTWSPGLPMLIRDRLILEGGWIERHGVACFNLYQPPAIEPGDADQAGPWLDHVKYVFPDDANHIVNWLAHRVQHPEDKINHALVLGGQQGIGKDTLLEPVKTAVGPWNFREASPAQVLGRFNGFLKAVILRINEARDLGEFDRFQFYDHMKAYTAAPPDTLRVDEKHLHEYAIINCCGVIVTTNHKTDGIFLSPDDRRHFVAWSDRTKDDPRFHAGYWNALYAFYRNGGSRHVAAFLQQHDLSTFDPKAPPKKTAAFWAIADANRAPEEPELADVLDQLSNPTIVTISRIQEMAAGEFAEWIKDRRNRRVIPHRLEKCNYVPVRNPYAEDGLWKILGRRQAVYAKKSLPLRDQIAAVRQFANQSGQQDQ